MPNDLRNTNRKLFPITKVWKGWMLSFDGLPDALFEGKTNFDDVLTITEDAGVLEIASPNGNFGAFKNKCHVKIQLVYIGSGLPVEPNRVAYYDLVSPNLIYVYGFTDGVLDAEIFNFVSIEIEIFP